MTLNEKYKSVTDTATAEGVRNLQVREQNGVLYLDGTAESGAVKDRIWDAYEKADPNFAGGDLVLNINVAVDAAVSKVKVVTESGNLNIRKGPGTNQPIAGKAAHHEIITLINRSNDQWWLVRTADGEEGYAYARYLEPVTN